MNYGLIKKHDVANGIGVRVSLFVSGCTHGCKECFNPEAWDFAYGQPYTAATEKEILAALKPWYIRGFSLLGGEPFEPENQNVLVELLRKIRAEYPRKTIWCYSGYLYDTEILAGEVGDVKVAREMLSYIDVLVDGEFHIAEKDLNLRFCGSGNQRIIDVQESLKKNEIVLWIDQES